MSIVEIRNQMEDYANGLITSAGGYDCLQEFFIYFDAAVSELSGELAAQCAINFPLLEQVELLRTELQTVTNERDAARRVIDAAIVQMGKETKDWQG